jgi:hypothetical protein
MTRRTWGILATVMGSAVGAWWMASQRRSRVNRTLEGRRDRGTVIFDNTPQASSEGII